MGKTRAAWAALLALVACARLPQIDSGQCGNGVIEEPEDCDGFPAESGAACRAPGAVGECHLDCSPGTEGACPPGWGCDSGRICRRPTGDFEALREIEVGSATTLLTGDFDGDTRSDLVSLEPFEGAGITRLRFHYFDERAQLEQTRAFPLRMISPVSGDLSGEGRSDILFSDSRIGLLRGRSDRSWVPDTFSSYRVNDSSLRTLSVFPGLVDDSSGFVVFGRLDGVDGLFVADASAPRLLGNLPSRVEDFVGDPAGGRLLEDDALYPCSQVLVAARGQSRFWLYDSCTRGPDGVGPIWRTEAEQRSIELDPPEPIDAAPLVADLNGDAHLDVLVGAGGRAYVSYGDGQNLARAVPYLPVAANAPDILAEPRMPLVASDVTGDGAPDFVFDNGIALSSPSATGAGFDYVPYARHPRGYWTRALVADLNGNGKLDFVAASADHPGVDFFNGTDTVSMTDFSLPTNRPVQQLVTGDFDGDLIDDLALTQISATSNRPDSLFIAFGAAAGPPLAPNAVAQVSNIEQVSTFREGAIDHIAVSSQEQADGQERAALALLAANGDRIPVASYELTTFAADGSTDGSAAVRMAMGGFLEPGHGDVLVLAFRRDAVGTLDLSVGLQAWLMPALASDGTPTRLLAEFQPELAPISEGALAGTLSLSATAEDFDGDGRDEAVLAMPRDEGARCAVLLFGVSSERLEPRGNWVIDEACQRVELGTLDADADGSLDLLLLAGPSSASGGSLSVLWNDGKGGFDPQRRTLLTSETPRAFASLEATTARPLTIAYVNPQGLFLIAATQQPREFDPPWPQVERDDCTGLVASDLNGDAAIDLAYAAGGNLNVLKAVLEVR